MDFEMMVFKAAGRQDSGLRIYRVKAGVKYGNGMLSEFGKIGVA